MREDERGSEGLRSVIAHRRPVLGGVSGRGPEGFPSGTPPTEPDVRARIRLFGISGSSCSGVAMRSEVPAPLLRLVLPHECCAVAVEYSEIGLRP